MSGFENPITGGQGALLRNAIKSPDYDPGTAGWSINRDGSAEFNDLTIRGTFFGTDYIIDPAGAFFYFGTPAAGNLAISIASVAGSDSFGNAFPAGIGIFNSTGTLVDNFGGSTGNATFGPAAAGHFTFDNAANRFNMFDQNAALTARLSALSTNSNFVWLFNTALKYFSLSNGAIQLGPLSAAGAVPTAQDQTNAAALLPFTGANPGISIQSVSNTADPGSVKTRFNVHSGNAGTLPGDPTGPFIEVLDNIGSSVANGYISGAWSKTDVSGNPSSWQTPIFTVPANWTAGGFANEYGLRYRTDIQDNLILTGAFQYLNAATIAAGSTTALFTLPAGFRPLKGTRRPAYQSSGTGAFAWIVIQPSGAVLLGNPTALGTNMVVEFEMSCPMGNLP